MARLRAHYNMLLANKDRWLALSFAMNVILIVFVIFWIMFDINNSGDGWIHGG